MFAHMALKTLLRGIRGIGRAAVNADPVDAQTLADRRRVCAHCEHATARKNLSHLGTAALSPVSICRLCKCNVQLKTRLQSETCPAGKW